MKSGHVTQLEELHRPVRPYRERQKRGARRRDQGRLLRRRSQADGGTRAVSCSVCRGGGTVRPSLAGGSLRGLLSLRWGQPGAETCKRRSRRPSGQLPPREGPARSSRGVVVHTAGSCRRVNPSSAPGRVSGCRVCLHFSLVWGEIKQVSAGGPGTRARTDGPTLPALVPLPWPRAGTSAPPCPARCGRFQNRTLTSEKLELSFF